MFIRNIGVENDIPKLPYDTKDFYRHTLKECLGKLKSDYTVSINTFDGIRTKNLVENVPLIRLLNKKGDEGKKIAKYQDLLVKGLGQKLAPGGKSVLKQVTLTIDYTGY